VRKLVASLGVPASKNAITRVNRLHSGVVTVRASGLDTQAREQDDDHHLNAPAHGPARSVGPKLA
jgi:hypothetical protein